MTEINPTSCSNCPLKGWIESGDFWGEGYTCSHPNKSKNVNMNWDKIPDLCPLKTNPILVIIKSN